MNNDDSLQALILSGFKSSSRMNTNATSFTFNNDQFKNKNENDENKSDKNNNGNDSEEDNNANKNSQKNGVLNGRKSKKYSNMSEVINI